MAVSVSYPEQSLTQEELPFLFVESQLKFLIHTFGCQMNKLDSELVAEALTAAGWQITASEDEADAILYNTCSVRDNAEQRVLSRIMQLKPVKKQRPGLVIGLMGCFAQRQGAALFDKLPHLDLVCGTRKFPQIAALLEAARSGPVVAVEEETLVAPGTLDAHGRSLHEGMQAYVSIMRGCNNFCSYCIVPYVRGREESRPEDAIVEEARALVEKGAKEIILLGQNVDAYGKDIDSSLANLLHRVHGEVDGVVRIRFVTSHPRDITEDLVRAMNDLPKVANYLHMPAQSGSSRILKAMNRGYTREEYDRKLEMIYRIAPTALVASDFIVGFPTETDEEFETSVELVRQARFQNSFVFKYSPRPGTVAEKTMPDDIPEDVKLARNHALLAAQEEVKVERTKELIGSMQEILVEGVSPRNAEKMLGRTASNLICVYDRTDNADNEIGTLQKIKIHRATPLTLFGNKADS